MGHTKCGAVLAAIVDESKSSISDIGENRIMASRSPSPLTVDVVELTTIVHSADLDSTDSQSLSHLGTPGNCQVPLFTRD